MKSALDTALTYLSRRALTHYELEIRLEKKGYSKAERQEAMERVESWGYVDDRALAFSFAQARLMSSSQKRVKQELLRRGIAPLLVEEVLEDVFEPEQELSQCINYAKKMWTQEERRWETSYQFKKSYVHISRENFIKQKIGQKLVQKGYSLEVIYQAFDRLIEFK